MCHGATRLGKVECQQDTGLGKVECQQNLTPVIAASSPIVPFFEKGPERAACIAICKLIAPLGSCSAESSLERVAMIVVVT